MIAMQPEGDQERCLTKKFIPFIIGSSLVSIFYYKIFCMALKNFKEQIKINDTSACHRLFMPITKNICYRFRAYDISHLSRCVLETVYDSDS